MKNYYRYAALAIALLWFMPAQAQLPAFFHIPKQQVNLFKVLGAPHDDQMQTTPKRAISEFVTYKEYKRFLADVKPQLEGTEYDKLLPHKNMGKHEIWQEYLSTKKFDKEPVIGVSWDAAMLYCKWRTQQDNEGDSITFIYRLPTCSEWLAAQHFLSKGDRMHDFNQDFSDWTLSAKDESVLEFRRPDHFSFDYTYDHTPLDPPSMRRKVAIGHSYLFQRDTFLHYFSTSYYAHEGYRQISFRLVKDKVRAQEERDPRLAPESFAQHYLAIWGLPAKIAKP